MLSATRRVTLRAICITLFIFSTTFSGAMAETPANTPVSEAKHGWDGVIGIGPAVFPKYTGGNALQTLPLPILSINYDETFFVEVQRIGVYVLASDDKKIGLALAAEPRLGWSSKDGARLAGMASRRSSAETGVTFDWEMNAFTLSLGAFIDANRTSRGSSQRLQLYKPFVKNNQMEIGALLSVDRLSKQVANYYFGVRANEVTASRAFYAPSAANNLGLGLSGTFKLNPKYALQLGINVTRLHKSLTRSPIIEARTSTFAYAAYGWNL